MFNLSYLFLNHSFKEFKKLFNFSLLILIPIILLINVNKIGLNKGAEDYEADYVYLINGLNLANSRWHNGYYYHPGTTVIIISAVIIKIGYQFRKTNNDLQSDVLLNPLKYLKIIKWFFALVNCFLITGLGLFIYLVTKELIYGVLFQSFPFFSKNFFDWSFNKVSPEPLITGAVIILLIVFLTKYYFINLSSKTFSRFKQKFIAIIKRIPLLGFEPVLTLFGFILGFILASKIYTIPLLLLPFFFIHKFRNKFTLLAFTFFFFIVLTLPIADNYLKFIQRLYGLFFHSGYYGGGSRGIIDINTFFINFKTFIINEPVIFYTILFSLLIIIKNIIQKQYDISLKVLTSLFLVQLILVIMVLKHFSFRYFIPIIPTLGLSLYLIFKNINLYKNVKIFLILTLIISCYTVNFNIKQNNIGDYNPISNTDTIKVYAFGCGSLIYALKCGEDNSNNMNAILLEKLYGKQYFYNFWDKQLTEWKQPIKINSLIKMNKILTFYGPEWAIKEWNPRFKLKFISEGKYLIETDRLYN